MFHIKINKLPPSRMIKRKLMSKHKGRPQLNQLTFVSDSCHVCSFFIISEKKLLFSSPNRVLLFALPWLLFFSIELNFCYFIIIIHFEIDGISSCRDFFSLCIHISTAFMLHSICFCFQIFFLHVRGYWDKNSNETAWAHIKNYFNCIMHSISTL